MSLPRRLAIGSAVAAAVVGVLAVVGATVLTPWFSWTGNALSDLGASSAPYSWLFNGGLIVAGLLGLPLALALWTGSHHPLERVGTLVYVGAVVDLTLIGVFPIGTQLHYPVSVVFFLAITWILWLHGSGAVLSGRLREGLIGIWLGNAHVIIWALFAAEAFPGSGIAIPESCGVIVFVAWLAIRIARLRSEDTT